MKKIVAGLTLSFSLLAASSTLVQAQENRDSGMSEAVEYTLREQILTPRADRLFHGEEDVSRLEFVMATVDTLYKNENFSGCFQDLASPATFTHLFGDVERDTWYGKQLCVGIHAGLIGGDRDGNFRPFATVTTAEASKILARAYGLLYSSQAEPPPVWYQGPMFVMQKHGAIGTAVKPQAPLSRNDMAEMFYALRNAQRYPETRDIGFAQNVSVTASPSSVAQVAAAQTVPVNCWVTDVRSPGAALYVQGRSAYPVSIGRMSPKLLRARTQQQYAMQKNVTTSTLIATSNCIAVPRSPGSAQMALGQQGWSGRLTAERMTSRHIRASAELRPHEGGVSVIPGSL